MLLLCLILSARSPRFLPAARPYSHTRAHATSWAQLRGMRGSSALLATARNFGANFMSSALLGRLLFDERAAGTVSWCLGAGLIVCGIALLGADDGAAHVRVDAAPMPVLAAGKRESGATRRRSPRIAARRRAA